MEKIEEEIRNYKDRLRILLIIYYFSNPYSEKEKPYLKKLLKTEVKIQKIDFLLRNPDYFSYELLQIAERDDAQKEEIGKIIKGIFYNREPLLRRLEMEKFFFGAFEDIDDIISFLKSIGFVEYYSRKSVDLRTIEKNYFITETAVVKIEENINTSPLLKWYADRCLLIKKYFGEMTGNELKMSQYKINEYKNTSFKNYIESIQEIVEEKYRKIYGGTL